MDINPIAFQVGPIAVRWYGIIMAIAVLLATWLAMKEAKHYGWDPEKIIDMVLIGAPLGWLGARLYYVIFNWDYYSQYPNEILKTWHGGLAIHGGIITAVIFGYFWSKRQNWPFWQLADLAAPCFILGQAIGRWGNFFNQEAYGYETNVPWAMYIDGAYRHPTFLYESLWNFGVLALLLYLRRRPNLQRGEVFLSYLGLYSVGRFIIEGLRTDSLMIGPLRTAQVVSLAFLALAIGLGYYRRKRNAEPKTR